MKKILVIVCSLALVMSFATFAQALEAEQDTIYADNAIDSEEISYDNTPINKFGRGFINILTCWAEVPAQVVKVSKQHDPLVGISLGAVEGTVTAALRCVTGAYDAVTFFAPPYDKPLMKPEYALKAADDNQREYLW